MASNRDCEYWALRAAILNVHVSLILIVQGGRNGSWSNGFLAGSWRDDSREDPAKAVTPTPVSAAGFTL